MIFPRRALNRSVVGVFFLILRLGSVVTIARNQSVFLIHQPSAFGINPQIAELLIVLARIQGVAFHAVAIAQRVLIIHPIQAHFGLHLFKA